MFHQHRRSVRCNPTYGGTHPGLIASMFCKSCNCNSSIATRIGFAASSRNSLSLAQSLSFVLDHIHTQLAFGMAHENAVRHTQNRRVELRLHQDGVRGRQVLRCTRGTSLLSSPLVIAFLTLPLGSSTLLCIIPLPFPFESIPHWCDGIQG